MNERLFGDLMAAGVFVVILTLMMVFSPLCRGIVWSMRHPLRRTVLDWHTGEEISEEEERG